MKVLSVSHSILNWNIPHAGGKTYAYYMEGLSNDPEIDLTVICTGTLSEKKQMVFENFNAKGVFIPIKGGVWRNVKRSFWDIYGLISRQSVLNSYYKQREYVKAIKKLRVKGYRPDVIILEWTQCVSIANECRRIFPDATIVASEHDVMFLGYERRINLYGNNTLKYKRAASLAKKVKHSEIEALKKCDIVMTHNEKDRDLLVNNGIDVDIIHPITAFYNDYSAIERKEVNHDVIFWGAMSRPENYTAALWFIDNVMPLFTNSEIRFVALGNKPNKKLLELVSENVIVTGYVDNPEDYFSNSLCFVAPLITGAGIKVKVLEALSSGIPVLTNGIGIEGIPAENGHSYFNCESADDYYNAIKRILEGTIDVKEIELAEKQVISSHFDLTKSREDYVSMIKGLTEGGINSSAVS